MELWYLFGGALFGLIIGLITGFFIFKRGVAYIKYEKLKEDCTSFKAKFESEEQQKQALAAEIGQLRIEIAEAYKAKAVIEEQKKTLEQRVADHKNDLEIIQKQLSIQFENLANKIFQDKTTHFKEQSGEHIQGLLNPLKERLNEYQKTVEEHGKEQRSLSNEIQRIVLTSENLSKALRGDVKAQGMWGEIILERILEESGLTKGTDYILQGTGMGLKHPEHGSTQKPDVIVMLPEKKHIIVDSKVSLTHYEQYISETDSIAKDTNLNQFLQSLRNHVKGLEERRYQDTENLGTPDFVLMFVPIEGAYSLAMQSAPELHEFAWKKKIVFVCPSTLFATLRTIASVWQLEKQNKYAQEIADQGGKLYDKISGFVKNMQKLGDNLGTATKTYEEAFKQLSTGRGNIISQTEKLKELGAKTSGTLPSHFLNDTESEDKVVKLKSAEIDA